MTDIWLRRRIAYWHGEADRCEQIGAHRLAAACRAQARAPVSPRTDGQQK